jgi:hypothetical protein
MTNWRKELKALARQEPITNDHEQIVAELHRTGSDRACALLLSSMVENALETILIIHMRRGLSKTQLDGLFGYDAPLGSFSAKIRIAYAFMFIDHDIRDDFDRIREIRNTFAHSKIALPPSPVKAG